jgi:hypothetical protein
MSAIQLLEQLGTSAELNRGESLELKNVRAQAINAVEEFDKPLQQWCVIFVEDEQKLH